MVAVPVVAVRDVVHYDTPAAAGRLVPTNTVRAAHLRYVACCAQIWANQVDAERHHELQRVAIERKEVRIKLAEAE